MEKKILELESEKEEILKQIKIECEKKDEYIRGYMDAQKLYAEIERKKQKKDILHIIAIIVVTVSILLLLLMAAIYQIVKK